MAALDRFDARLPSDVRKLEGRDNEYRLRVGDYRVLFRATELTGTIEVFAILHRREAYR